MTEAIKQRILQNGCYSPEENLRIYNKWFAHAPRKLFRAVDRKYHITRMTLCDAGCSYGVNLLACHEGSYGIEINTYEVDFATSIGLKVYNRDILNDNLDDLPKVDAIWCSAVMEHVTSPHIFLRTLAALLKDNGLLMVYVPIMPLIPALLDLPILKRYKGYNQKDHINAFVPSTLRFFCERAGFKTLEVGPMYPSPFSLFNHVPYVNRLIGGSIFIGRKIANWDYPDTATRQVAESENPFIYKHAHYKQRNETTD